MNDPSPRPDVAGTPEAEYNLAHTRSHREQPNFRPLGVVYSKGCYARYAIKVHGEVRLFRAIELSGEGALFELFPNVDYWRKSFPRGEYKIDSRMACAWLVRRCQEAGPFEPPEHLRPRAVGRPRKVAA